MASKRSVKAAQAIAKAWEREQELVKQGKGTRDWSPEQQKDIIENCKAYDSEGRAFEGHHMKSVAEYPDYQGDPNNIQFLTRDEHRDAHGDFTKPTNGQYDPVTKTTKKFDDKVIPCDVIELSEPICRVNKNTNTKNDKKNVSESSTNKDNNPKINKYVHNLNDEGVLKKCFNWGTDKVYRWISFSSNHPIMSTVAKNIIQTGVFIGINKLSNYKNKQNVIKKEQTVNDYMSISASANTDNTKSNGNNELNPIKNEDINDKTNEESNKRKSPDKHQVRSHKQIYYIGGKQVEKDVPAYQRGGKKNNK